MRMIELNNGEREYLGTGSFTDCTMESADEMKDFIPLVKEQMGIDAAKFLKDYSDDWENPQTDEYELIADEYRTALIDTNLELESLSNTLVGILSAKRLDRQALQRLVKNIAAIRRDYVESVL